MTLLIGRVLTKVAIFAPKFAMNMRAKIADSIMSRHTFGQHEQFAVIVDMNNFMATMPVKDRPALLELIGVPSAPTWRSRLHTGGEDD